MKKTGGFIAIEIDQISVRDGTKLCDIKMCIQALQRIKGPRHYIDPLLQYAFTLRRFEPKSKIMCPIGGLDREHMRMMHISASFITDKTIREADKVSAVERPEQHTSGGLGRYKL